MPTRPRLKRETRKKEGNQSKELLLVRLRVSGLGLEPKWLLNRFKNYMHDDMFEFLISKMRYVPTNGNQEKTDRIIDIIDIDTW